MSQAAVNNQYFMTRLLVCQIAPHSIPSVQTVQTALNIMYRQVFGQMTHYEYTTAANNIPGCIAITCNHRRSINVYNGFTSSTVNETIEI